MDNDQTAYFFDRYSRMSDEELSYLMVSRGDSLSDEAAQALRAVLKNRDPGAIETELHATVSDVKAQIAHAEAEDKKHQKAARQSRMFMHVMCAIAVSVGLGFFLASNRDAAIALWVIGVGIFLYMEFKRLLWRFIAALFNPDSS